MGEKVKSKEKWMEKRWCGAGGGKRGAENYETCIWRM
jgi:hypothetical protein